MMSGGSTAALIAGFSASLVEFVEALTIVLAVGTTRGWTSALTGAGAAVLMLVVVIAVAGPALTTIPIGLFQMVVGVLLLLFGMRWLQKAILRSAGIIALHDEKTAFEGSKGELAGSSDHRHETMDWLGFTTALKAVLLEGVEVAFIVLAIGSGPALLGPAISGAARPGRRDRAGRDASSAAGANPGEQPEVRRRPHSHGVLPFLDWRGSWRRMVRR